MVASALLSPVLLNNFQFLISSYFPILCFNFKNGGHIRNRMLSDQADTIVRY